MTKGKSESLVRDRWSRRRSAVPAGPGLDAAKPQQQFKDECDVNRIVKNAMRGIPPRFMNSAQPAYGDFSMSIDLTAAYNKVRQAEEAFMTLPAELRLELGNDPARIGELTREQAIKHKLLKATQDDLDAALGVSEGVTPQPAAPKSPKPGQGAKAGTEPAATD